MFMARVIIKWLPFQATFFSLALRNAILLKLIVSSKSKSYERREISYCGYQFFEAGRK